MKKLLAILLVSACAVPEDRQGTIYEISEYTVTIRGSAGMLTGPARPTQAMQEQAREICPGAEYLSANPLSTDYGAGITIVSWLYMFRCPR